MFRVALHLRRLLAGLPFGPHSDGVRNGLAVGLAGLAVLALGATSRSLLSPGPVEAVVRTSGAYLPTNDNWLDQLTNPSAWRNGGFRGQSRPMSREEARREREEEEREARERRLREEREEREETMERAREYGRARGTYRTVCVRLCDGFFFPISFATTPDRFGADENACLSRCGAPARLYVYPNPGGEPEQMTDLKGQPYTALKSAFLFRTEYVEACTCKPHPWEQEALARHRLYAERARKGRGAVAAKVQPARRDGAQTRAATGQNATAIPATDVAENPQRPDGAMLLGVPEIKRATRRAGRSRSAEKESARERRSTNGRRRDTGGRPDWAARVFGGNY